MRARDLLLGIGVVASVCAHSSPSLLRVNSTPERALRSEAPNGRRMVSVPAGTLRPLYGAEVKVDPFQIDRDPVTREEYAAWKSPRVRITNPRAPMTEVTWAEARAFCLARGGRLPTLAEWEYVAAIEPRAYTDIVAAYMTRSANAPVETGSVNRFGVRGLHNLVWEWVGDPNARIVSMHEHGAHDLSCAGAAMGATDQRDYPAFLRSAFRSGLTESTRLPTLGFRCAA